MNSFRTTFSIDSPDFVIDQRQSVFMTGSCFAANIAVRMVAAGFDVLSNPTGVVYNPLSVLSAIRAVSEGRVITAGDLVEEPYGGVWSSFLFHGSFSGLQPERVAAAMTNALNDARQAFGKARVVIITLGTSWIYQLADTGEVVSNCHKFPASYFTRRRLTVAETVDALSQLMEGPLAAKRVIFTVSPVRHLKDGANGNSISKASLLLAVDELTGRYDNAVYFPAYELMNDDLRDYRFYDDDMIHVSRSAVDYIWDKFKGWAFSEEAVKLSDAVEKVRAALAHRPLNPDSAAYADFRDNTLKKIEKLATEHPYIDLSQEIKSLRKG